MTEPTPPGDDSAELRLESELRHNAVRDHERVQQLFWQAVERPREEC